MSSLPIAADEALALRATHLSKRFSHDLTRSLRYALGDIARELRRRDPSSLPLRPGEFLALDDVSFDVHRGEALAVVGANGAGKSTLLKVLYDLIKPDTGTAWSRGSIGALIELGTGFEPVLSGRENIGVAAALIGLHGHEVADLVERVADFAQIGDALDAPVRYYSSGMAARLSFAVAAMLEPSVLLVDEVLAVGDLAFQRKCLLHMRQFLDHGGALVFVSHNPHQMQAICSRALLLEGGTVVAEGEVATVLGRHFDAQASSADATDEGPSSTSDAAIVDLVARAPGGGAVRAGEEVELTVRCRLRTQTTVLWAFNIWSGDGWVCITGDVDMTPRTIGPGLVGLPLSDSASPRWSAGDTTCPRR